MNFTPEFLTAKDTRSFQGKFSPSELVRAIRFSVAAEYEAVQLYDQIIEATDDPHVKAVIRDIINEERLHAGQFLELLYRLVPDEKAIYDQGYKENQELK